MPLRKWDAKKKEKHDETTRAMLDRGAQAIRQAKSLVDNFVRIGRHVDGITQIALGKRPPQKPDPRLHTMLAAMQQLGKQISRARTGNITEAQTRSLRVHLSAIIPLLSENAGHADALAKYWTEMHKQLGEIVDLFDREGAADD